MDRPKAAPSKSHSMCGGQFKKEVGMLKGLRIEISCDMESKGDAVQHEVGRGQGPQCKCPYTARIRSSIWFKIVWWEVFTRLYLNWRS